jgi:hypothetical protein
MSKSPKQREEWIPCPPGKLAKFAGQERVRQRRQLLVQAGSACGAVVAAVGIGWFAYRRFGAPMDPVYAGIACSRVRELGPKFMMGQLDEELTQQIKSHVEQCEACRTLFESMQPKMSSRTPQQESREQCQCSTCRRDGLVELLATSHSHSAMPTT